MEQGNKHTELEQNQGAQQGNIDNDRDMGRKQQPDAAGTEREKMQNNERNEDKSSGRQGNTEDVADNKGQKQVSAGRNDSHAGITRTTHYGPDMPGSWREPDGHKNAPGATDTDSSSQGRMRD